MFRSFASREILMRRLFCGIGLLFLYSLPPCLVPPNAGAEDWRQFRGPNASGLAADHQATENPLPSIWGSGDNVRWQTEIPGDGWSAPIVVQGRVIVATAVNQDPASRDAEQSWRVICLDAKTGAERWSQVALQSRPRQGKHRDNTFASETPVSDGKHIVAYFGMMGVFCYDLGGQLKWKKDLGSYSMRNNWGTSSSPTMHDGKVFLQIDSEQDSFMVALDVETGDEIWRQPRDEGSNWGSAMIWENSVRAELVAAGSIVRSYSPDSGDLLWQLDIGGGGISSTPSANESLLVVGRGGRGGSAIFAVRAGASGDITDSLGTEKSSVAWSKPNIGPERSSPLLYQGYVYLLGGRGGLITCLDAATGDEVYRSRLPDAGAFWASPWAHDGAIYCPDSDGKTYVIAPGPELNVIRTNVLAAGEQTRYWASSAIADGTLYIRSSDTLYAIGKP